MKVFLDELHSKAQAHGIKCRFEKNVKLSNSLQAPRYMIKNRQMIKMDTK